MEQLLSVVIPTLNRKIYLVETLEHFIPQVERNQQAVELIVCNNNSTDDTDEFMKRLVIDHAYIGYYFFDNRVDMCDSFSRSIAKCKGKYVIIWGDDDLPAPFLLETLLDAIKNNPQAGLIHFNRIIGYDLNPSMSSLKVCNTRYEKPAGSYSVDTFITKFFLDATFISSIIFLRSAWEKGLSFDTKKHYGYEFLGIIYSGVKNMSCLYLNYPLCIQRKPLTRIWMNSWPLYCLIGTPNMLKDFEKEGILNNGLQYWQDSINNSFLNYCYTILWASAYKKQYRSKCREINSYQPSYVRKFLTYFIIYMVPSFSFGIVRKIFFKTKN
jgi:glycosyltransferase involved in cell wall biosynthesis